MGSLSPGYLTAPPGLRSTRYRGLVPPVQLIGSWRVCHEIGAIANPARIPEGRHAVQRRIPGTFAAYTFLIASGLFVAAAFMGALWLTEQGAVWLGHALPHPLL